MSEFVVTTLRGQVQSIERGIPAMPFTNGLFRESEDLFSHRKDGKDVLFRGSLDETLEKMFGPHSQDASKAWKQIMELLNPDEATVKALCPYKGAEIELREGIQVSTIVVDATGQLELLLEPLMHYDVPLGELSIYRLSANSFYLTISVGKFWIEKRFTKPSDLSRHFSSLVSDRIIPLSELEHVTEERIRALPGFEGHLVIAKTSE